MDPANDRNQSLPPVQQRVSAPTPAELLNVGKKTPRGPMPANGTKIAIIFVVLSVYGASFILPAIDDGGQNIGFFRSGEFNRVLRGWEVFCQVILKLPFSLWYLPAWLANPVLWFGLCQLAEGRWHRATKAARFCVALALSALLVSIGYQTWLTILVGYYIWLLSMIMFLVGVGTLRKLDQARIKLSE